MLDERNHVDGAGGAATAAPASRPGLLRSIAHRLAGDADVLPVEGNLPSFEGATGWLNSEPLTPQGLRGRVVVVDFLTYTCINWLRTAPYVKAWPVDEALRTRRAAGDGAEWPLHPHQDIESLTYVVEGHILQADSLGNNGHLEPGAAQVMTFSHRGDLHSEKNGSPDDGMRFIQFWILPSVRGLETRVQQRQYRLDDRTDRWLQIMGPTGTDGLDLAQDARALVSHLTENGRLEHTFGPERGGYLYVIDGRLSVDGESLKTGDAAKITSETELGLSTDVGAELILIDVPLEFESVGVWAGE
jgi:redox-sensitive bicupin YhaK (pirin superfamily)